MHKLDKRCTFVNPVKSNKAWETIFRVVSMGSSADKLKMQDLIET